MNSLANKTAFYIAIAFTLLLAILSWLFFAFTTNQFFTSFDVNRQVEDLNQTLGKQAISIQAQLANELSQRLSPTQHKDAMPQTTSALQKITVEKLKNDALGFISKQEKEWPFILLLGDQQHTILAANPADFVGMNYQSGDRKIKLISSENEFVLPLDDFTPTTMRGGYFLIVIPFPGTDNIDTFHFSIKSTVLILFGSFLTIGILLIWLIVRRSLNPIKQLNIATTSIIRGSHPEPLVVEGNDEIAQLTKNFNLAIASLKQQEALRKQNLSDVSHELRTPLTIMIGKLDAWRDGLIKDEGQVQSALIQEVKQLSLLVNDLQDLALVQVGELSLHQETFNLAETLKEITQASQYAFNSRNVTFKTELDSGLLMYADVARFKQIIHNLCINAIKHNQGDIEITLKAQHDNQYLNIQVIDNGSGIGENQINAVFERNTQFSDNTSGLGLGLSIAKNLVELHKGKISVNSTRGHTCFILSFPLRKH